MSVQDLGASSDRRDGLGGLGRNGFFDDSGIAQSVANQSVANQSPDPTRSMCLAIMAWAVWWKKVLMENPLNVLVGI